MPISFGKVHFSLILCALLLLNVAILLPKQSNEPVISRAALPRPQLTLTWLEEQKQLKAKVGPATIENWCKNFVIPWTRKFDSRCHYSEENPPDVRRLLVSATGRSGTSYVSSMLVMLGLDVPHERVGDDGSVSWVYAVNDLGAGYPWKCLANYIDRRCFIGDIRFARVVHLVRHPLEVISSLGTLSPRSFAWIDEVTGVVEADTPPLLRQARHWMIWNKLLELYADERIRLTDFDSHELCLSGGFPEEICSVSPVEGRPRVNDRQHVNTTWEDLELADPQVARIIKQMALEYGFD